MREYQKTHPWVTFNIDLNKVGYKVWHLFGEAKAKCETLQILPHLPEATKKMLQLYLIKGVQGTTAIEGNTLSEDQIRSLIEGELKLPKSIDYQGTEIKNVVNSFNEISNRLKSSKDKRWYVSPEDILDFNKQILKGLPVEKEVIPGKIRQHTVGVLRYRAVPWKDCEYLLVKMCKWLEELDAHQASFDQTTLALLRAIIAHLYLAWIHAFGDGNGRTARLVELQILLDSKIPTFAAHLLSNHYNKTRLVYYQKLDETSKNGGNIEPFLEYALQGFVDGLDEQINYLTDQQLRIVWKNYVYDKYKEHRNITKRRQRDLLLEMFRVTKPIPLEDVRTISSSVAKLYEKLTGKAVSRDVNTLESDGMLLKLKSGYYPNFRMLTDYYPSL